MFIVLQPYTGVYNFSYFLLDSITPKHRSPPTLHLYEDMLCFTRDILQRYWYMNKIKVYVNNDEWRDPDLLLNAVNRIGSQVVKHTRVFL